jgi:ubiquinone/menaquinone biosynthesis C-methylase UbiE
MHQTIDYERALFFDKLSEIWDASGPSPSAAVVESFLRKLNLASGSTILDIGAGTGMMIPYLFELKPEKVIAVDLSEQMLSKLRAKYEERYNHQLVVIQGDVHYLSFQEETIDAAICNGVYPHFNDKTKALAELYRVLKPGGVLTINHFAGRTYINQVHGGASHPLIRKDLLDPVTDLALQVERAGFKNLEMADNENEYYLIAKKRLKC